jgi:choline dehydrogenase-like flavoprotein
MRPVIIFVHDWPELSISWRHQLPCFASLGFRFAFGQHRHPRGGDKRAKPRARAGVDSFGAVYGVKSLRVIDASIMPDVRTAPTNLATIMLAEHIYKMALVNAAFGAA